MARIAFIAALVAIVGGSAALTFILAGLADVAATSPHWGITRWVLSTTMKRAVERRAREIEPPGFLELDSRIGAGALAYDAMCAVCHGTPGEREGVVAEGLNPEPPLLVEESGEWSPAEIFWITKHGIRMTGMPAFGPTHSDEELWEIVAFVRRLPDTSADEYRALRASVANREPDHGHSHQHEVGGQDLPGHEH